MLLRDLHVLALDGQATAAHSAGGHLLELGWVPVRAVDSAEAPIRTVVSQLVRLPDAAAFSPAAQRVTGLSRDLLADAPGAEAAWQKVVESARSVAAANRLGHCPAIIHYARFETPFLRALHGDDPDGFPLRIICTLEIAQRLLPGLPRRGLRALAGYLGHSVPPLRRSGDHAVATAMIWRGLVPLLARDHGIERVDQLHAWLEAPVVRTRAGRIYPMPRAARLNLPTQPGVYRFRRINGDLLYIGKAASLKQRVNSYFRPKGGHAEHILEMLSQAAAVDTTPTATALEAALLECDEIKRHAPPYNISLQNGRRRLVFVSRDLCRQSSVPDDAHCIGPLTDGRLADAALAWGAWIGPAPVLPHVERLQETGCALLGVSLPDGPDNACLEQGLALFWRERLASLRSPVPLHALRIIGRSLWWERSAARQEAKALAAIGQGQDYTEEEHSTARIEPVWTPELVARRTESMILRIAHGVRRARWLLLVSESSVAWAMSGSPSAAKRVLRFENGRVVHCETVPSSAETPWPIGYRKKMIDRLPALDLMTMDRLRVLTTELRRVLAEARVVEVRLSPATTLDRRRLANLLMWI
jgi:DNA polymerase-3 subunit epsilon